MKVSTQFRLEEDLYDKVKIIAEIEHRSINAQMEYMIEKSVRAYQEENGPITGDV